MIRHSLSVAAVLCLLFAGPLTAGEPAAPPDKPKSEPKKAAPDKADNKKAKADLLKELAKIQRDLISKDAGVQAGAVNRLVVMDTPDRENPDTDVLEEIFKLLFLSINKLKGDLRLRCVQRLCEIGYTYRDIEDLDVSKKVGQILTKIEKEEKGNANINVCVCLFDFILKVQDDKAPVIISGFLKFLSQWKPVFELLRNHSRTETLQIVADLANDRNNQNNILRRDAVQYLGAWWDGPPLYNIRVPALLKALDSPVTSGEALAALKQICFPDHSRSTEWKRWWKRLEGKDDIEILREDFMDAYERERIRSKKETAAMNLSEWIREWGKPAFKWAVPVLVDPLLKYEERGLQERVISALGGIGDRKALKPLGDILTTLKGAKRSERVLMADLIKNMARIAASEPEAQRREAGTLLAGYLDSLFEGVVESAAEAMGLLNHTPSIPKLVSVMKTVTKMRAAMRAAESLGKMRARETLPDMLEMLRKSLDNRNQTSLAYSIVKALRDMDVRSDDVVNNLIIAIGSKDDRVCQESMRILGKEWQRDEAVHPIKMIFEDDKKNLPLRKEALESIAAYPPDQAAATLYQVLRLPSPKDIANSRRSKKLAEKVKAERIFHSIAAEYFNDDDHVLADHRGELIAISKDDEVNPAARGIAISLLGSDKVWNEEECLDHVVNRFEDKESSVLRVVVDVLKAHPSKAAMEKMINRLPNVAPPRPAWQHYQLLDVIRHFVFLSNQFNHADPQQSPDYGFNGKSWKAWWKKVHYKFEFAALKGEDKKK